MKQEIIKLDPKEYGLEESKAKQISEMFTPMLNKMVELEEEANEVFSMDKTTEEAAKKSKEVRLKYVKVRTGTAEIHKAQKAFYLAGGRFIDGWKNAQILASQGIEEKLLEVENYAESIRKQEIEKLFVERSEILTNLRIEVIPSNVGYFDDELWNTFLSGARFNFNKKQEELAAAKKEAERMEAEAIELAKKQKEEEMF